MRTFLISQNLWSLVSYGYIELDTILFFALTKYEKKNILEIKKEAKVIFFIQSRMDVSIFLNIVE